MIETGTIETDITKAGMSAPKHAVILLASGLSQRLGQPKQLLIKDGIPLISYMLKLALATRPKAIMVVIPKDNLAVANAIAEWIAKEPRVKTVRNQTPQTGMGHSLYLAIDALNQFASSDASKSAGSKSEAIERVLIMGVDQVLLDDAHLADLLASNSTVVASGYESWQLLSESFLDNDKSQKGLKERPIKNIVGLPLVIDYPLLKQWQSKLGGDKGLRHLIRALPTSEIKTLTNQRLSYDIDTPAQFNYAKAQGWLDDIS